MTWLYVPGLEYCANRIVYTGRFSPANNGRQRMTCVVEFEFDTSMDSIAHDLKRLPGDLKLIAVNQVKDAYVIQDPDTRHNIKQVKPYYQPFGLYLLDRFAEWEYYNTDKCIEAALQLAQLFPIIS